MLIGLPSAISVPLTEPATNLTQLTQYLATSLVSFAGVVVLALGIRRLIGDTRVDLFPIILIGLFLGTVRGWSVWWFTDLVGLTQPDILVRILTSSILWAIGLVVVGYLYDVVSQSRSEVKLLRDEVRKAKGELDSLDQQREWLAKSQLQGLEAELADSFIGLSQRLNDSGFGPGSYREIATELREAARLQVRPKSIEMYSGTKSLRQLFMEAWALMPNASIIAGLYLITAGGVGLRLYGDDSVLLAPIAAAASLWISLTLAKRFAGLKNIAWLAATAATAVAMFAAGADATAAVSRAVGAGLWSQSLILGLAFTKIAIDTQQKTKRDLERALDSTELDIQTLRMDLETQNIALAKYLHAILQTRLMSYAMQLERGEITNEQKAALQALLTNPLMEYQAQTTSLAEGLEQLRNQWGRLISIEFDVQAHESKFDSATLQIVREAIANSVRHGFAEEIRVQIKDGQRRQIRIIDNGIGPRVGDAGMGTMVYNQLCRRWRLERNSQGGATLVAEL